MSTNNYTLPDSLEFQRLRRAVYEDQPLTVYSEALRKATGLEIDAPIPFDVALANGMDDRGTQRIIGVVIAALATTPSPDASPDSGEANV